ncbi:MAG TPA: ABC transporter permease [Bacteroidota bacterium]
MSFTSFIASRHLRSGRGDGFISFITLIAIVGIALGSATLIIALSVLGGFEKEITDKVIGFATHIQVQGFQNLPLRNYEENIEIIRDSIPGIRIISPFVSREALIRSRDGVDGILLKGIDPANDATSARRFIVEGRFDVERAPGSMGNIVLGRKLAAKLSIGLDDKVTVFGIGRSVEPGQMRVMQFRVMGLYESGMAEYDDIYAFTSIADAQTIFQLGESVTGYEILLTNVDSAAVVAARIGELLGYPHYARTMYETYRNLFSWIDLQKKPVPIILGLIIIVATVNIIGTLLMMVLDKTKTIGILMSMGASRGQISRIFLRKGILIGLVGTVLGDLLAFILSYLQLEFKIISLPSDIYFMSSAPVLIVPSHYLLVSAISLAMCLLCSSIPARLASRLTPVNAMRFG